MKIANNIAECIGKTPLVSLSRFCKNRGIDVPLIAKVESMNPGGSAKDRVALSLLESAEKAGLIGKDAVIIEPTSGNTGVGLALIAAVRGYRTILTMPESMSIERRRLLKAFGAEIVLTPASEGMTGAVKKAEELAAQIKGAFIPDQFANPNNPLIHELTTGPEIWEDTEGKVDTFVACIGTGGSVTGIGRYLKSMNPSVQIIGAEPSASPLLTKGYAGAHGIQGIGANFVPETLDRSVVDAVLTVSDEEALLTARALAKEEGILAGISSGAAVAAAMQLKNRPAYADKQIVVLLPDTGERYLSTKLFSEE